MQGRKKKFDLLFLEHSGRVLRYAINRGLSLEEAEDVVADTFLVCWRRFDDLPGDPLPWLLGIAHRTIANHRRSSHRQDALKRRLAAEAGVAAVPTEDAAGPDGYELKQALRLLSEKDREVILLTAVDGLSGAEAARVVGCSRSTFAVRIFRARSRLWGHIADMRAYISPMSQELETSE